MLNTAPMIVADIPLVPHLRHFPTLPLVARAAVVGEFWSLMEVGLEFVLLAIEEKSDATQTTLISYYKKEDRLPKRPMPSS